jgi:uncharacterized protein (DUF433 family)
MEWKLNNLANQASPSPSYLEALATYPDRNQLREEYPELEDEDIRQSLEYAAANLDDRIVELRVVY